MGNGKPATRRRWKVLASLGAGAGALAALATVAWACADASCSPTWRLDAPDYACDGRAMLTPGNDTRINLLLLMRSLAPVSDAGKAYATADWYDDTLGHVFASWTGLRQSLWPEPETTPGADEGPECAAPKTVQQDFAQALATDSRLSAADRTALMTLRGHVGCPEAETDAHPAGPWATYLLAADAFYKADYAKARAGFAALDGAPTPWLRETAAYMQIRVALRRAMAGAIDKYGDFSGIEQVDKAAVREAGAAIDAYLKAWPQGRYAASARGLTRRVLWLSGQDAALARAYEALLRATPADSEAAADLVEEIDNRLLEPEGGAARLIAQGDTPLLLAIADLKQMRSLDAEHPMPLPAATLAAQAPRFAGQEDLFGLITASRAYYAGEDPRTILARLPDAARAPSYTPLAFSRQMLRGMALSRAHDPNEAGFWRELMGGAKGLWQRPLVELGLALRWQRDGRIDFALAPQSPISDTTLRQLMLQTMASPAMLRTTAADSARPDAERNTARFTLLYKGLTRGAYADFGRDLAAMPSAPSDQQAQAYAGGLGTPSIGRFTAPAKSDEFACPSLAQVTATLAKAPQDKAARLCLGEFYRLGDFDGFSLYAPFGEKGQLGQGKDLFPGTILSRDAIYAALIADKTTPDDLRAYALYRAIRCYAPSAHNGCAPYSADYATWEAADVPKAQRKAWYDELKTRYPASRWAKALRYYW